MSLADELRRIDEAARRKLLRKLPSWEDAGITVPASINLEQCSSELTARYKASLVPDGSRVADLTGGLGADSWAFSQKADAVWYNEREAALMEAVRGNFASLGVRNVLFNNFDISAESLHWLSALRQFRPDVIYLDPARRNSAGGKVFLLEDCSPDVTALLPLLLETAPAVLIKVSPMADITMLRRRLEGCLESVHIVGAQGECKELLCVCCRDASFAGLVLSEDGHVFDSEAPCVSGALLFVPSAAMTKSGLHPASGAILLDNRTGYCRTGYCEGLAPFGSFYSILENLRFCGEMIKTAGAKYPSAEVTARALPVSSEELRKKMRTKPGGPVHIFACPVLGERRILVCKKVTGPEQVV